MQSFAVVVVAFCCFASTASAQATRTWVASDGSDASPCSASQPCKTFTAAIAKTAAGGEINCVNAGGFGPVTITKSITIDCKGTFGAILAGANNGVVINLTSANEVVRLRGLSIQAASASTNGVRVVGTGTVMVEDCVIEDFNAANSHGISFQPSGSSTLLVSNTTLSGNGNVATGGGVLIQPTGAGGAASVVLDRVTVARNANNGVFVNTTGNTSAVPVFLTVRDSLVAFNNNGINVISPTGATSINFTIVNTTIVNNASFGILANGATVVGRVARSTIMHNATGVSGINGALVHTSGTNVIDSGTFSGATIPEN